jgi:soluble lytic murein transglycosylase-like protein
MEWRGDASVASEGNASRSSLPLPPAAGRVHLGGPGSQPDGTLAGFRAFYGEDHLDEFGRGDEDDGSLRRLADDWGSDFPSAVLAAGLYEAGAIEDARRVFRDVAFEFRVLDRLFAQGREVSTRRPITLERRLWQPEVDNRREPGYWWGMDDAALRYPGPGSNVQAWVDRHGRIRDGRADLRPLIEAATREIGDAYLIRQNALDTDLPDPIETEQQRLNWRSAFPRAYARMLQQHAERYDLNPYLFWALMLVESAFNPDTVSIADAYGLTQVIPKTGELVVQRMGLGDTGIHALLEAPAALAFGSYYLSELLHKFHGQEMLACVAYNAGAHAVARWLDWRGELMEMDEFIESVPFDQSRRYAQRIVQHMSTYRWVWFGTAELYIGNTLDVQHEDNINF